MLKKDQYTKLNRIEGGVEEEWGSKKEYNDIVEGKKHEKLEQQRQENAQK